MQDSDLDHTAIDEEFNTGDKACVIRGEEDNRLRNLVRMSHPSQRNLRGEAGLDLPGLLGILGEAVHSRSIDGAGADYIDANLAVLKLIRPRPGEGSDGSFCGAIDAKSGHTFDGYDGGIEHNRSTIGNKRKSLLHGEEHTFHIGIEGLVEVFFRDLIDCGKLAASCVGEEYIDATVLLPDLCVEFVEIGQLTCVGLYSGRVRSYLLYGRVEHFLAPASDDRLCAFGDKTLGGSEPDSGCSTGDECYFAFKFFRHLDFLLWLWVTVPLTHCRGEEFE